MGTDESVKNLVAELRRGTLSLSVLSQLHRPQYGYSLLGWLAERGLQVDQNTLYPLLRRLESQGLLDSDWSLEESRPRRYYVLSPRGRSVLSELAAHWRQLAATVHQLLKEEDTDGSA